MSFFWEAFVLSIIIILIAIILIFATLGCTYLYTVNIAEANVINVYADDTLIYHGKKAFVDINSGGMTTTITIYKQLFPFYITDKTISSANVKVN